MANAIAKNRPHRMSGDLALHVVDVMESFHLSAAAERKVKTRSTCERPAALPAGLPVGELD
jgi:hypothetical protein